jgi:hypothetical protein
MYPVTESIKLCIWVRKWVDLRSGDPKNQAGDLMQPLETGEQGYLLAELSIRVILMWVFPIPFNPGPKFTSGS